MASNLGSLAVYLTANTKQFDKGMNNALLTVKNMAGTLAGLAGITSLGYLARQAYNLYSVQEEGERRLTAVLNTTRHAAGLTSQQLFDHANQLQRITGIGDETIMQSQAILATFKNIRGDQFKQATGLIMDMAAVMGTDARSSAIQLGKALQDPIRGVTALRRVGVSFNQQQLEQIKTMQKSGNLMGAQKIILEELRGEFGGTAAALNTPMKQLSANLGDIKEGIGAIIVELFGLRDMDAFGGINNAMAQFATDLRDNAFEFGFAFRSVFINVKAGFLELLEYTRPVWENLWNSISITTANISTMFDWIGDNWTVLITNMGTVFKSLVNTIKDDLMSVFSASLKVSSGNIVGALSNLKGVFSDFTVDVSKQLEIKPPDLKSAAFVGYENLSKNLTAIDRQRLDEQARLEAKAQARRDAEAVKRQKEQDAARKAKSMPYDTSITADKIKLVEQKVQVSLVRGTVEAAKAEAQARLDAQNIELMRKMSIDMARTAKATESIAARGNNPTVYSSESYEVVEAM